MKFAKKIISIGTIIATAITGLILIMLLFDVTMFGKSNGDVLMAMATLGIGGFFAINSLNMVSKNKIIGWVSLALISASVFLILLTIWISFESDMYFKVTVSLGLLSVLFNIIVSSGLSLGKTKLIWQVLVYLVVGVTDLIATLAIFGLVDLAPIIPFFLMLIIISIIGVIILKVLAKKAVSDMIEVEKDMVKISKQEYQALLEKAKKYDEIVSQSQQNN